MIKHNKSINQNDLSSECWSVQFWGLTHCEKCNYKDTPDCGGENIVETGKNSKGCDVPLRDVS